MIGFKVNTQDAISFRYANNEHVELRAKTTSLVLLHWNKQFQTSKVYKISMRMTTTFWKTPWKTYMNWFTSHSWLWKVQCCEVSFSQLHLQIQRHLNFSISLYDDRKILNFKRGGRDSSKFNIRGEESVRRQLLNFKIYYKSAPTKTVWLLWLSCPSLTYTLMQQC